MTVDLQASGESQERDPTPPQMDSLSFAFMAATKLPERPSSRRISRIRRHLPSAAFEHISQAKIAYESGVLGT
jgi:hypothetical protein